MRSHLKLSLILAAAVFPALAHSAAGLTTEDLQLNLSQAKTAFHQFQAVAEDGGKMATLYGTTSKECMGAFVVNNDSSKGEFTITLPKGSDPACLDYSKLTDIKEHESLTKKDGSKLVFSDTVEKVLLRGKDPKSDRSAKPEELLDADTGKSMVFTSLADQEKQKKSDAEMMKLKAVQSDYLLAVSCVRGLNELDLRVGAIDNLAKVKDFVAKEEIGDKWFKKIRKETDEKIFKACSLQITRAKTDDLAECDARLARLVGKDPEYFGPKVRALYMTMVNRYKNSTTLSVNEAYDKAAEMIETLRGMDLDDAEVKAVDTAERDLLLAMLNRTAKEGEEMAYNEMAEKFKGHLLEHNDLGCLDDNAALFPAKRMNPACREIGWMASQLPQSAALNVAMIQVQAGKAALQQVAEQEQMKHSSCMAIKAAGGASTPECQALEAKFAAAASASANAGIATTAFAEPVTEARAPAATDAGIINSSAANYASGLTNTGANSVQQKAPAPAVAPKQNQTNSVRVFR